MRDKSVSSKYWFVLNSNVRMDDHTPAAAEKRANFFAGLKRVFMSQNILNFVKIKDEDDQSADKKQLISKMTSNVALEVGGTNDYLHAHCTVTIYHRTTVLFDVNDVSKYFYKKYGLTIFGSPPKIIPDPSITIYRYEEKQRKQPREWSLTAELEDIDGKVEFKRVK